MERVTCNNCEATVLPEVQPAETEGWDGKTVSDVRCPNCETVMGYLEWVGC